MDLDLCVCLFLIPMLCLCLSVSLTHRNNSLLLTIVPTLKYFVDGDMMGQDYTGGRDYDSLLLFVQEILEVKCTVLLTNASTSSPNAKKKDCSDQELGYIAKMKAKSSVDRQTQIQRLEHMAGDAMKAELRTWLRQRLHILRMLEQG